MQIFEALPKEENGIMICVMGYFLDNIRAFRASAKLSQAEAAVIVGVTRENYNSFENGRRTIPEDGLNALLDRLGITKNQVETWHALDQYSEDAIFNAAKELFSRDPEKAARMKILIEERLKGAAS